jgi:hypothetical protein
LKTPPPGIHGVGDSLTLEQENRLAIVAFNNGLRSLDVPLKIPVGHLLPGNAKLADLLGEVPSPHAFVKNGILDVFLPAQSAVILTPLREVQER